MKKETKLSIRELLNFIDFEKKLLINEIFLKIRK